LLHIFSPACFDHYQSYLNERPTGRWHLSLLYVRSQLQPMLAANNALEFKFTRLTDKSLLQKGFVNGARYIHIHLYKRLTTIRFSVIFPQL
jgi:hypothetical protein